MFIDAVRDIAAGEELGYDYQIGRDKDDPPNVDEIYACRCGSPQCRGTMLWPAKEAGAETSYAEAASRQQSAQEPAAAGEAARRASAAARAINQLIEQLAERGFGVVDDFVDRGLLAELRARCLELHAGGALRPARVGRGANEQLRSRGARRFHRLASEPALDAEQRLLAQLDELRVALNRALMAGLEDFQGHFALYPRGAAYARHFDRLVGSDVRAISAALYLNDDWRRGRRREPAHLHRGRRQRGRVAAGRAAGGVPLRPFRARGAARRDASA